jgi:hypothetical protein
MTFELSALKITMKNFSTIHFLTRSCMFLVCAILVSCGSSRRSIGIEEGWELLAERKVNFVRDKDEIPINSKTPFTAIKFKVEDHEVRIDDVKIYFQNGDKLEPNMDVTIPANEMSREIDLAGEGRYLDRIEFKYRTTGSVLKGRANVVVLGRKSYRGY